MNNNTPYPSVWDQNYRATADFKYGEQPNAFLVAQAARLAPASRILLPGDGEGRNGVWLARQGHRVTAVDASAVGLAKAQQLATQHGVALTTELADLEHWAPAPGAWDAMVLNFVHLPRPWRRAAHQRLARGLRPGGLLLLEAFQPAQLGRSSGGPKSLELLYPLDDIVQDFAGLLTPLLAEATETVLDEGPGHQGAALVTRYIGQRTA